MVVSLIVAVAGNGAIGKDNQLLWRLPDDLKRFKQLTMGKPMIMGRKTFQSIGRPLPGRTSIVITRSSTNGFEGVSEVNSVNEALKVAVQTGTDEVFVIGGGEVYQLFLPLADRIYLTIVDTTPEGDAYFKLDDPEKWQVISSEKHSRDERHSLSFEFVDLERIR